MELMYQMVIDESRFMFPLFTTTTAYAAVERVVKRCGIPVKMIVVIPERVENYIENAKLGVPIDPKSDLRNIVDFDQIKDVQIVELTCRDKPKTGK